MGRRPLRRGLFDGEGFPGNPPISRNRSTDSINVRARVGCFRGCGVAVGGLVKSPCLFRNMRPAHQTSAPHILLPAMWHNALDRGFRSAGIPGRRPFGSLFFLGRNPPAFEGRKAETPLGGGHLETCPPSPGTGWRRGRRLGRGNPRGAAARKTAGVQGLGRPRSRSTGRSEGAHGPCRLSPVGASPRGPPGNPL